MLTKIQIERLLKQSERASENNKQYKNYNLGFVQALR